MITSFALTPRYHMVTLGKGTGPECACAALWDPLQQTQYWGGEVETLYMTTSSGTADIRYATGIFTTAALNVPAASLYYAQELTEEQFTGSGSQFHTAYWDSGDEEITQVTQATQATEQESFMLYLPGDTSLNTCSITEVHYYMGPTYNDFPNATYLGEDPFGCKAAPSYWYIHPGTRVRRYWYGALNMFYNQPAWNPVLNIETVGWNANSASQAVCYPTYRAIAQTCVTDTSTIIDFNRPLLTFNQNFDITTYAINGWYAVGNTAYYWDFDTGWGDQTTVQNCM